MKTILTILLIALSVSVAGQVWNPTAAYDFENDMDDISTNSNVGHNYGYIYSNTSPISGSYSLLTNTSSAHASVPINLTDVFTISFWLRANATDMKYVLHAGTSTNGMGIYINSYGSTDGVVYLHTVTSGSENNASTDGGYYNGSSGYSHNIIVTSDGAGNGKIYIDGVNETVDGSIRNDFEPNDSIMIGKTDAFAFDLSGFIDDLRIYSGVVFGQDQVDSLFAKLYEQGSGGVYAPVAGRDVKPFHDGIEKKPMYRGMPMYFKKKHTYTQPVSSDTIIYVFNETFETLPSMDYDTIVKYWQANIDVYDEGAQTKYAWGGSNGYVWRSFYPEGAYSGADGHGFNLRPIISPQRQLYISYDLYVPSNYDWYNNTYGTSTQKMPFGMRGGGWYDNWTGDKDSTWGWGLHSLVGGDAGFKYYYYHHGQALNWSADQAYWDNTGGLGGIQFGNWENITFRVTVNSPGKADGIAEYYVNGNLVSQHTGLRQQAIDQYLEQTAQIDQLYFGWWFGGGSNEASDADNYIYIDNICAYYYTPLAVNYSTSAAASGATIPIVRKNSPVYQPSVFTGRTYTASADTLAPIDPRIDLLPSGVYTITNTITGHSNPIIFTFLEFNDGSDEAPGSDSYVNVYSGTGTGKTLLWKFDGGEDGGTYPTGNYTINATSATFEYHNGYDGMRNEWMKISYW